MMQIVRLVDLEIGQRSVYFIEDINLGVVVFEKVKEKFVIFRKVIGNEKIRK